MGQPPQMGQPPYMGQSPQMVQPLGYQGPNYYGVPAQINNYLVPAILATLFCCMPLGVVAIVHAAQVNGKAQAGDYQGAMVYAQRAKTWCWVAFGCGLVATLVWLAMAVATS